MPEVFNENDRRIVSVAVHGLARGEPKLVKSLLRVCVQSSPDYRDKTVEEVTDLLVKHLEVVNRSTFVE